MEIFEQSFRVGAEGLSTRELFFRLQEAANAQCAAYRLTGDDLREKGLMWVVLRYLVRVPRWPEPGETVRVLTWPGETRHGMYLRYFRLVKGEECLMEGSSLWAVVDRQSRRMLQPNQSGVEIPAQHTGMESRPPMAPKRRETVETGLFTVPEDYLDGNGHMNNTRYFDLGQQKLDIPREQLIELRAEFANEALLGDVLRLGWLKEEGLGYLAGESDRAGACFRMEWRTA